MMLHWWHWIILGLVLGVAELLVPAFFIVWFGLGAIGVGVVLAFFPTLSLAAQVLLWTLSSLGFTVLWFRVFKHHASKTHAGTADGDVVGEIGVMVARVEPFQRGLVRFQKPLLGADQWTCLADEAIDAGERIRVKSIEGNLLRVVKC